jgi:hypothetical protein
MDFDHFSCNFHKRSAYITNAGAVRPEEWTALPHLIGTVSGSVTVTFCVRHTMFSMLASKTSKKRCVKQKRELCLLVFFTQSKTRICCKKLTPGHFKHGACCLYGRVYVSNLSPRPIYLGGILNDVSFFAIRGAFRTNGGDRFFIRLSSLYN